MKTKSDKKTQSRSGDTAGVTATCDTCIRGQSASQPLCCLSQFLVIASWEAADDDSDAWPPATQVRDLNRVPSSWLRPGPALGVAGIEATNQ